MNSYLIAIKGQYEILQVQFNKKMERSPTVPNGSQRFPTVSNVLNVHTLPYGRLLQLHQRLINVYLA